MQRRQFSCLNVTHTQQFSQIRGKDCEVAKSSIRASLAPQECRKCHGDFDAKDWLWWGFGDP
jgi:hypothetical protein